MKILFVSNLYPPHHVGGYELGCHDVAEGLRARGHTIHVLTSTFKHDDRPLNDETVERTLQCNLESTAPPHNKISECKKFYKTLNQFKPDVVYFWNLAGLSFWLPLIAHVKGYRSAFFLSDTNFVSWRIGAWLSFLSDGKLEKMLQKTGFLASGWPIITNRTCHFASNFLRQIAIKESISFDEQSSLVTHWGIELAKIQKVERNRWPVRRLLYVGQLSPLKGVHTAIKALAQLIEDSEFRHLRLTIVGGGLNSEYEDQLKALADKLDLVNHVNFRGVVPRASLSNIYAHHDLLIFPSEWDEPFAITPLEAIQSGLAVVSTTTGGSGELFIDRKTALTFQAGNVQHCAEAIRRLLLDKELFAIVTQNARQEVETKHSLRTMIDAIEQSIVALPQSAKR